MSQAGFKWHGQTVLATLHTTLARNLLLCAMELVRDWKKALGVSANGAAKKAVKARQSIAETAERLGDGSIATVKNQKGKLEIKSSGLDRKEQERFRHSLPGEPPRTITGFLRRNVVWRDFNAKEMRVKVGLFRNAMYGFYLDRGVRNSEGGWRIAPRPWILSTFLANFAKYGRIAVTGRANG